ncbi:hypothetical protein [Sorangium cellulosum]|uniref:Uncharacterized protein n=1 Tax=Sorangium cellulosum TaxID=56 RepID=A0A150QTI9_SORCE|nr:hypothetical protein [Sorangium cellulosum]KYF70946.1 hypothetical protein BE15_15070 [Sorangium cellulosum]
MKSAVYVVLFTIAGCSQGVCRSIGSAPGAAPSPAAPNPGHSAAEPVIAAQPDSGEQEALGEHIAPLRKGGRRHIAEPPDDVEDTAYVAWVAAAALAAQNKLPPPAAPPGFALRAVPGRDLWVLSEEPKEKKRRRGAAAVVLRTGAAAPLIVEAPHTFFDRGTLPVALAVFDAQRARALVVNTSHRYGGRPKPGDAAGDDEGAEEGAGGGGEGADDGGADGETTGGGARATGGRGHGGGGGDLGAGGGARGERRAARERLVASLAFADVAHAERSFFLSAHRALLQSFPGMPAVQLHGFQDSSAAAAAIASAVGPGADLERLLAPLRAVVSDGKVLAYPADIDKLGGATNVQARWSRQMGAPFYHVEMSRTLRDKLIEDAELRRRFAAAFAGIATGKGQAGSDGPGWAR